MFWRALGSSASTSRKTSLNGQFGWRSGGIALDGRIIAAYPGCRCYRCLAVVTREIKDKNE
jgi:hypothetical protein